MSPSKSKQTSILVLCGIAAMATFYLLASSSTSSDSKDENQDRDDRSEKEASTTTDIVAKDRKTVTSNQTTSEQYGSPTRNDASPEDPPAVAVDAGGRNPLGTFPDDTVKSKGTEELSNLTITSSETFGDENVEPPQEIRTHSGIVQPTSTKSETSKSSTSSPSSTSSSSSKRRNKKKQSDQNGSDNIGSNDRSVSFIADATSSNIVDENTKCTDATKSSTPPVDVDVDVNAILKAKKVVGGLGSGKSNNHHRHKKNSAASAAIREIRSSQLQIGKKKKNKQK